MKKALAIIAVLMLAWNCHGLYVVLESPDLFDSTGTNLALGSIVYVFMYNSQGGSTNTSPLQCGTNRVADSVNSGQILAYATTVNAEYDYGEGYTSHYVSAQFEVLGTYDSLYIRCFNTTNSPVANYCEWAASVTCTNSDPGTWYCNMFQYQATLTTSTTNNFVVGPRCVSMSDGGSMRDVMTNLHYVWPVRGPVSVPEITIPEAGGLYTSNAPVNGAVSWACASNGCFIYYTNSQWVIATNIDLNTNQAYLYKTGAPAGAYTPVHFISGSTTAGYQYVYLPGTNPPAGLYLYDMDYYTSNAPQWCCAENGYRAEQGADGYYHLAWQAEGVSSSWQNVSGYLGVYMPESNATGTVYAESQLWETGPAIYTSVTYAVQLTKIGASNDFFAATNRQHKVDYYADPTCPTAGDSNYYDDQELNLTESSWNWIHSIDWSYSSYNPVWVIGLLDVPPSAAPEAGTNVDLDIYAGFEFVPSLKPIAEWKFQYCTNKFW